MRRAALTLPLLLLSVASCKFIIPNGDEQSELVKRQTFANGAPNWFTGRPTGNTQSSGIIPTELPPVAAVAAKQEYAEYPTLVRQSELAEPVKSEEPVKTSALERINQLCPGMEADVNAALTNVNRDERITQYQTLSQKCPMSADLQLWLAGDYAKANRLLDARTTYEHVLVLDANNEDAKTGIASVEAQMK